METINKTNMKGTEKIIFLRPALSNLINSNGGEGS
jgi:hypothetical protein